MTDTLLIVYLTLIGAALGSFLNVCMYRWPAGESVVRPRSRCPSCGTMIPWYDNLPVVSWLVLRGKCRTCGAKISIQYPLVELTVALIWLGLALWKGPSLEAVRGAGFLTLLLGIAVIDGKHQIIPDQLSLGGTALGLGLAAWPGGFELLTAVIGAAVGYGGMWVIKAVGEWLLKKPALGVGDIHMMAMIGAFLGFQGALLTIFLGSALGLLIGVPVAWFQGKLEAMGTYLPLGTFLAMGATVTYLWGEPLLQWYLSYALAA